MKQLLNKFIKKGIPSGLVAISLLMLISVVPLFLMLSIILLNPQSLSNALTFFDVSQVFFIFSILLLVVLNALSGILILQGRKLGWYLGGFTIVYAIVRNINQILLLLLIYLDGESVMGSSEIFSRAGREMITIIGYSAVLYYFFSEKVTTFFDVKQNKLLALAIITIPGILLLLVSIVNIFIS